MAADCAIWCTKRQTCGWSFLAYYQLVYHSHIHFSACAPAVLLLSFRSERFLKNNISQRSAMTPLRCGAISEDRFIANFFLSVSVKEV